MRLKSELTASNSISFCIDDYSSEEEMFKDIATIINILTKNKHYQCSFRCDDTGIYVLDFDYDNPDMGSPMCFWLDSDQLDCLYTSDTILDDENNNEEEN